ncbi:hypothetical protein TCAL_14499 [Tigriopus californicus]|uniref:Uncharacterized protein n=1 Tax=Tigriopus californicus TaxID=6832 RepID=A0A553PU31_TIGCA|nr:hypothetical protein TCAL_14499 [Tigriopus californicus]
MTSAQFMSQEALLNLEESSSGQMDQPQEAEEEAKNFEIILALGVDSKSTDLNQTPLLGLAILSKLFHVVKFLMNNGVDGRATDSQGNTILHMLAKCGLFVNELVHQEHLCHKNDEIKGTKCVKKQLTHENNIMYTSDMFSSFYPKSAWGKLLSFLFLTLVPSLIGAALICLDIWQDMILTEEYDSLRNNSNNSVETSHKYDVAFRIRFASQFLHLITSIPICIWICCSSWRQTFNLCRSGGATSTLDNLVTFLVILPPIVSAPAIYCTRGLSSTSTALGFMMMSNAFSATLIICLSISRMVTTTKIVFGHDQKRSQNN